MLELLEIWDDHRVDDVRVEHTVDSVRNATLVHGLTAHGADLGRAVLKLVEAEMIVQAYPLVRLMLEDSILVLWLESEPGSWRELIHKASTDLEGLIDEITRNGGLTPGFKKLSEAAAATRTQLADSKGPRLTVRRQMHELRGAGASLYTHYRVLSQYAHAGKPVADLYSEVDASVPGGIRSSSTLLLTLTSEEISAVVGHGAAAFLQSLLAWDRCTIEQPNRTRLLRIAERLGVQSDRAGRAGS
ncbi:MULTISPECIES: DUF5677 domain-containing protein [Microbacterium]|uniref:DUF5677 domain-containing protein n=1 Tax=Microbacterium TaxID=33882 RepID=UPI0028EEBA1E|nr:MULTISPECIES: DUF5677 domain-containing protein [Microbacterium]